MQTFYLVKRMVVPLNIAFGKQVMKDASQKDWSLSGNLAQCHQVSDLVLFTNMQGTDFHSMI